jgi:hypothetical protein
MACDINPTLGRLIGAGIALGAMSTALTIAAVTNGGIFTAFLSPGWMMAASISAGVAALLVAEAARELKLFIRCLRTQPLPPPPAPPPGSGSTPFVRPNRQIMCRPEESFFDAVFKALAALLIIASVTCLGIAAVAWIPMAAQIGIVILGAELLAITVWLAIITKFAVDLGRCLSTLPRP